MASRRAPRSPHAASRRAVPLIVVLLIAWSPWLTAAAAAQGASPATDASGEPRLCEQSVPPPLRLPPAGSPPVVYLMALCFAAQGNVSLVDPQTYLHYVTLRPSRPSQDEWVIYDDDTIDTLKRDFDTLWNTQFLDDLSIEVTDYHFANGVVGKLVTYHLEERQRVKMVSYEGSRHLDRSDLETTLRERGAELRLDTFLDASRVRKAEAAIRQQLAEKGYVDPAVTHEITALPGEPKIVSLTFRIDDGPRLFIRDIEFIGNRRFPDEVLERAIENNRAQGLLSTLSGKGAYKADKFADDALKVEAYYRDRGFADAQVGEPVLRPLDDSPDGASRWIQLRIPIAEGERYRLSRVEFDGNSVLTSDALRRFFKLTPGDLYSQQTIRDGLEHARDAYGAAGYMEFTAYPELTPRVDEHGQPVVDVTMHVSEGQQYTIHRITFTGNTTTRDDVIRREMQLVEGGVFDTEALKHSVRRLNQLGYFKPIEGSEKDLTVARSPDRSDAVDISLALEEQNRNQVTFGAGLSQYDGVFGNLSFTTANFLGRGESLTVSAQKGSRASNYQVSFTEPTIFSRPISAGFSVYSSKVDYLTTANVVGYSQVREGASVTVGRRLFRYSRLFTSYAYEVVNIAASADFVNASRQAGSGSGLYLGATGRDTESRITPSFEFNTVDNPFRPRTGTRLTATLSTAGGLLGGTTSYIRPEIELVRYFPVTRRTGFGLRGNAGVIQRYGGTRTLPFYLRYFLGGEYQIRGVDLRTVGPSDASGNATGGDKFVLFNAEYYLDMFGPVRLLLFHDAGQAFGERQAIDLTRLRTSSGIEARFMMPVLNVPFRFIYAWNIYRDTFQPSHTFKFAVGTTF